MNRRAAAANLAVALSAAVVVFGIGLATTGPSRLATAGSPMAAGSPGDAGPQVSTGAATAPGAVGTAGSPAGTADLLSPAGTVTATPRGTRQRVLVDEAVLAPGRDGSVRLDLAPGLSRTATLRAATPVTGGYHHWTGELAGVPDSMVTVVRQGSKVSALVSAPDGNYTLTTLDSGEQVLAKVDPSAPDADLPLTPPAAVGPGQPDGTARSGEIIPPGAPAADSNTVVDVLVAYTPGAATDAGGTAAIESLAATSIAISNDSFAASGVNLTYNLVGTVQSTGTSGDASEDTLHQLTGLSDGSYDDLHAIRNSTGADLVSLLADDSSPYYCGIAWYPASASYGFSVVAQGCAVANLTFPHELGHNLGASHDRYVDSSGYTTYGHGLVNLTGRWRTIMAYNSECVASGFNCQRLARWSNPDQTYLASPLGIDAGQPNAADNRAALNNTVATVAAYRASVSGPTDGTAPVPRVTAPARAYSLSTTLTAGWTATDAGSGVASFDVRYRAAPYNRGFGTLVYPPSWQHTAATSAVLSRASRGGTYCFSVRARDQIGNVSAWTAPRCTAIALDDRSLARSFGWTQSTGSGFYVGTAIATSRTAVYLTRTGAQTKRIYLVATRCARCGTVGVYWNGALIKRINLYSGTTSRKNVLSVTAYSGVRSGTVTVRSLTSGKAIQIDGLVLSRA